MPSIQNSVIHQIILTINGLDHDDFTEVELYPQVVHESYMYTYLVKKSNEYIPDTSGF